MLLLMMWVVGTNEGRSDILVYLPGELEPTKEAAAIGPTKSTQANVGMIESKLLEALDVLCLRFSTEQCQAREEKGTEEWSDRSRSLPYCITKTHIAQEDLGVLFVATADHSSSGDIPLLPSSDAKLQGLGMVEWAATAHTTKESLFCISDLLSGADEYNATQTL
ncbi:Ribosomal protein S6 kinase delta-1 [Sciurus carolinensis]|uniref:Ribosomal protein S6 kinase delta-1 n=1 Tax=Sciurus carolinensis TaxID=30640 RepID=A0AA41NF28_SCICA|nr:Ribosomal protein S6 kinase delta-1 [Sciurus carolinensis]